LTLYFSIFHPLFVHALKRKSTKLVRNSVRSRIIALKDQIVSALGLATIESFNTFHLEQNKIHLFAIGRRREIYRSI
jgi:hypothetical protein